MEGSIANQDEAEKCRDIAKTFLSKGDFAKASKFFEKSLKLYPLPGVNALKEKADKLAAESTSSSSSSSSSSNINNNTSSKADSSNSRSYTVEQELGAKKVLSLAKKSHYEVLGLEKSASQADIKKAYRKMALKYHPDKNSAPSAEGAFKAISTAFDTLSDASKREVYDQYGHEEEAQMRQQGGSDMGGMSGFRGFRTSGNMHEVSPEEIFNMFFQGAAGPGFRAQFGGRQRGHQRHHQQYNNTREDDNETRNVPFINQIFQFLPIIIMLLMSMSTFSGQNNTPLYSLQPHGIYQKPKSTGSRGVSPDIKYYVNEQFDKQYKPYTETFNKLEKQVESDYKQSLSMKCSNEKAYKSNRIYQARFKTQTDITNAKALPTPACDEFDQRFKIQNNNYRAQW